MSQYTCLYVLNYSLSKYADQYVTQRNYELYNFVFLPVKFRTVAASNGLLISKLVSIFGNENIDIQLQALRAVGNLCYNEG